MGAAKIVTAIVFIALMTLVYAPGRAHSAAEPSAAKEDPAVLSEKAEKALHKAERRLNLQTELPTAKEKTIKEENRPRARPRPLNISADVARYILWAAVIVVAVVIMLTIRDNLWSNSRARRLEAEAPEEIAPEAAVARMDKAQLQADDLARQGNFAEAMHVLLLQSVNELRRRLDVSIAASLTSREILQRIGLPSEGRAVFGDIIGRVEISYFGAHQPGQEEYLACRRSFDALTNILRRGLSS